jgi:hypothetical protein
VLKKSSFCSGEELYLRDGGIKPYTSPNILCRYSGVGNVHSTGVMGSLESQLTLRIRIAT